MPKKIEVKKTLYETILTAMRAWMDEQDKKPHLQFLMGTLDRVKLDFYNQLLGSMLTMEAFLNQIKGSRIDIDNDGAVSILRKNKPRTKKE